MKTKNNKKMVNVELQKVPEDKGNEEISQRVLSIAKEKNIEVAKLFNIEPRDFKLMLYYSSGSLKAKLHAQEVVFAGYIDGTEQIHLVNPESAQGLFTDLWDETEKLIIYTLTKYYLCKKYFPNKEDFNLYYKYISDLLGQATADKLKESSIKFDMKFYVPNKRYTKEQQISIALYLMKKYSGIEFIYKHLDKIIEDKDISKSIESIYNKSLDNMIKPEKELIIKEERRQQELDKMKRQEQFRLNQQYQQQNNQNQNKRYYSRAKAPANKSVPNQNNSQNNNNNNSRYGYSKKNFHSNK